MQSFYEWLQSSPDEAPAAENLALVIARSGGISLDDLSKVVQISPETLKDLLKALEASGQVIALKVGGKRVYRAAG